MLYEIEEGELPYELRIHKVEGGENSDAHDEQLEAAARINALCEVLRITPSTWSQSFLHGVFERLYERPIDPSDVRMSEREGDTVGTYVTQRAFDALPIENMDEGTGSVDLTLQAGVGKLLVIHVASSLWTNYPPGQSDEESELEWAIEYTASFKNE